MANGPKSEKNLADAFAGESQANRKYLAFGKQLKARHVLRRSLRRTTT